MTNIEKAQLRTTCLIQAMNLKQNTATAKDYENKDVVEIAKELEIYILKGSKKEKK